MEVGLLLGQNANLLLPTGGTGKYKVDNLRVRRMLLGKHVFILEGYHPKIWRSEAGKARIQLLRNVSNLDAAVPKALFPELLDVPMEIP